MILLSVIIFGFGLGMLILYFFTEMALQTLLGYVGAWTVRLVTFGRIRMDPVHGPESSLASGIGMVSSFFILVGVFSIGL